MRNSFILNQRGSLSFHYEYNYGILFPYWRTLLAVYNVYFPYTPTIHYRTTENQTLLSRASTDVNKYLNTNSTKNLTTTKTFSANYAIIITWDAPSSYPTTIRRNLFQLVLATDGNYTFAIFNYKKLFLGYGSVGYSENICNFATIQKPVSQSTGLVETSNVHIKGRYVLQLTNYHCFKPEYGVKFQQRNIYVGYHLSTYLFYWVLGQSFPDLGVAVGEIQGGNFTTSTYFTSIKDYGSYKSFRVLISSSNYKGQYTHGSFAVVLAGTVKTSSFQYGTLFYNNYGSRKRCMINIFSTKMVSVPAIKLNAHLASSQYNLLPNVWLRNVTNTSFDMCFREVFAFSGTRNITVHYIAVSGTTYNYTEFGAKLFQRNLNNLYSNEAKYCERFSIKRYLPTPNIFVMPEEESTGDNGELVAWVRKIHTNSMEICAKSSKDSFTQRFKPIKVHYQIQGNLHPCNNHNCPSHLECQADYYNRTYCTCIKTCLLSSDMFCGTDHVTYPSMCHLHRSHCKVNGNNTKTSIKIAHYGKCESYPYQSGIAELYPVPKLSVAFCKYISLISHKFLSTIPMHVLLTVTWNQNGTGFTHDASATWSEDVTTNGFKACVLVAGRYYLKLIDKRPSVYWVAFQKGLSQLGDSHAIEFGFVNMTTWYTGSRCQPIYLHYRKADFSSQVLVSVEHTKASTFSNAMTAWVETNYNGYYNFYHSVRICARELENFDGKHEGIKIHWLALHQPVPPYFSEKKEILFPSRYLGLREAIPAICRRVKFNDGFPTLPNPIVIVSAWKKIPYGFQPSVYFSHNDVSTWVESVSVSEVKICYKSIRLSTYQDGMIVSYTVLPVLCTDGWEYINGECIKKMTSTRCSSYSAALKTCNNVGATLPTLQSPAEAHLLEQFSGTYDTWIGLSDSLKEDNWVWESGSTSTYRKWLPGKPSKSTSENCAVVDGSKSNKTYSWDNRPCSQCNKVVCQKNAGILKRACSATCLNNATCIKINARTNGTNTTDILCKCADGFVGKRCGIHLSTIPGCTNYTLHTDAWRHINNTVLSNNSCDGRKLRTGWHRFSGAAGTKLYNACLNRIAVCGTKSPGWLYGAHPSTPGQLAYLHLRYYTFYCADDHGKVVVRNCGKYFTYKFTSLPYWSCDYGVCTV